MMKVQMILSPTVVVRRVAVKVNLKVGQGSILRIGPRKHKLSLTIIFSAVGVARRAALAARIAAMRRRGGHLHLQLVAAV